jgi:hypothetical protein
VKGATKISFELRLLCDVCPLRATMGDTWQPMGGPMLKRSEIFSRCFWPHSYSEACHWAMCSNLAECCDFAWDRSFFFCVLPEFMPTHCTHHTPHQKETAARPPPVHSPRPHLPQRFCAAAVFCLCWPMFYCDDQMV